MPKMQKCKVCGADIASNAKQCPQCGAKNKKTIFKKWWFWVIVIAVIAIIASNSNSGNNKIVEKSSGNETEESEEKTIEYTAYDVTDLFDELKNNALKAQQKFKGQYVELTGYLGTIDSDGNYIGLEAQPDNWDYMFENIQCKIKKSSEQLEQVMELQKGDKIIVRGKITDVGEVLGYYLDIDSIN